MAVSAPATSKESWQSIMARLDKAAADFKSMTARITYVTHTDVINENTTETGTVVMQKVRKGEMRSLIDFLTPDKRTVAFENRRLRIYYPKIKTVQEWDLGKHGEQLDQFLLIGFGTSGTSLAKNYTVTVLGTEPVPGMQGVEATKLILKPKAGEAKDYIQQLELLIPDSGDPYPLQEKISLPSGDYRLITYSDLKTNVALPPDALKLKLPVGFKTEYPGK